MDSPVDEESGNTGLSPESGTVPSANFEDVQASPAFQQLKRQHRSFVFPLAIAFLLWYFAYVLLADYAHDFMATPVFGNINIGLILGLAQFVTTFAITTWYVSFANRKLDPAADAIRHELDARAAATNGRHSGGTR